jgi:hypothetical protein
MLSAVIIPITGSGGGYTATGRNILVKQTGCCADWVVFKILA